MAENRECEAGWESRIEVAAPVLAYLPRNPVRYSARIGLIGAGGIAPYHLRAYRSAGYEVVAIANRSVAKAEALRSEFFPEARVFGDAEALIEMGDVDVVDIATPPEVRIPAIERALARGKHVLSQKPFVTDLDVGMQLVEMAAREKVKLAVNQNGRWAPHFSWMRQAVSSGLIGDVVAVHMSVHWDHNWTVETAFNDVRHLILADFGIHWFDMVNCFTNGKEAVSVYATTSRARNQRAAPDLLGQVHIRYEDAQASIAFDGSTLYGARDRTIVVGTKGTLTSDGPDLNHQQVTLFTEHGYCRPELQGDWFTNGFHGAMGELLCAIEEDRDPLHSAKSNLYSLALCFAAVESAATGRAIRPGTVRALPA